VNCVLDSSAAFRIVRDEAEGAPLRSHVAEADEVSVPELFLAETANVAWKYYRQRLIALRECVRLAAACRALPDSVVSHEELIGPALDLACRLEASVYDMLYLILAQQRKATLLTFDRKLARLAASQRLSVISP
jgi:predicted nucleic acid-binding protein